MKKETKSRMIEEKYEVFVAEDGTTFDTARECVNYEKKRKQRKFIEEAEKLRIEKLDNVIPVTDIEHQEDNNYSWYAVQNKDDLDLIAKACGYHNINDASIIEFNCPEILCIETLDYAEEYEGEIYCYTLSNIMENIKEFMENFGYKVKFEKE